jgi:hypothetical protein
MRDSHQSQWIAERKLLNYPPLPTVSEKLKRQPVGREEDISESENPEFPRGRLPSTRSRRPRGT